MDVPVAEYFVEVAPFELTPEAACQFRDGPKWQVQWGSSGGARARQWSPPKDNGGPSQFVYPPTPENAQHVLVGTEGWLLGYDCGEWGGSLREIDNERMNVIAHPRRPIDNNDQSISEEFDSPVENVRGICCVGDCIAVIRGLNHMIMNDGAVECFRGSIGRGLNREATFLLPSAPAAFAVREATSLIVVVDQGLVEIQPESGESTLWTPVVNQLDEASQAAGRLWTMKKIGPEAMSRLRAWPFAVHWIACHESQLVVGAGPILIQFVKDDLGFRENWLVARTTKFPLPR